MPSAKDLVLHAHPLARSAVTAADRTRGVRGRAPVAPKPQGAPLPGELPERIGPVLPAVRRAPLKEDPRVAAPPALRRVPALRRPPAPPARVVAGRRERPRGTLAPAPVGALLARTAPRGPLAGSRAASPARVLPVVVLLALRPGPQRRRRAPRVPAEPPACPAVTRAHSVQVLPVRGPLVHPREPQPPAQVPPARAAAACPKRRVQTPTPGEPRGWRVAVLRCPRAQARLLAAPPAM
jgi:hypothetical protein